MALRWLVCMIAVLAAGCATGSSTDERQADDPVGVRVLRIGVSRSAPPLIYEQDGETRGLEADMARKLAAELNMQPRFVPMFFPNLTFEIHQKNIDIIMAGMSITPARRRELAFAEPYMIVGQQALVRADDAHLHPDIETVRTTSARVATEASTTGNAYVTRHMPNATRTVFPTLAAAVEALERGRTDIVVTDSTAAAWIAANRDDGDLVVVPGLFTQESLAWAVHQDNKRLLGEINGVLRKWKADGTLDEMIARWVRPPSD